MTAWIYEFKIDYTYNWRQQLPLNGTISFLKDLCIRWKALYMLFKNNWGLTAEFVQPKQLVWADRFSCQIVPFTFENLGGFYTL